MILEQERIIIDSCFYDMGNIPSVLCKLEPEDFNDPEMRQVFVIIKDHFSRNVPVDFVTVKRIFKEFDGSFLGNLYFNGMDLQYHIDCIRENGNRKRLKEFFTRSVKDINDDKKDFNEVVAEISNKLFKVLTDSIQRKEINIPDEILDLYQQRKQERLDGKTYSGIPSGFEKLDHITGGWQPGNLIIIGGRSSHGKSTLVLDFFYRCGLKNISCLFLTLEQQSRDIFLYLIQKHMGLYPLNVKTGNLCDIDEVNLKNAVGQLRQRPFHLEDSINKLSDVHLKIRSMF